MMKHQFSTFLIISSLLTGLGNISNSAYSEPANTGKVQFTCSQSYDQTDREYIFTTFAWIDPENKKPLILWKRADFSGNGFDPQKRCEIVSPQFQKAYDNGSLKFLTYGVIEEQPVICTARQIGEDCDTQLLTLLHQDNAEKTLEQLSDILLGYADAPLQQSSKEIIHQTNERIYVEIDIENFLNQE